MALTARCGCGKQFAVADVMAGRTARCPACGEEIFIAAAPPALPGKPASKKVKKPPAAGAGSPPAIAVSPTIVTAGSIGGILAVIVAIFYFGPWRVGNQWAAMSGRANDEATDVVLYAIQAYESEHGMYDASRAHRAPALEGPANFVPPMMAFTMPRNVIFMGKTNQGNYSGTYDTTDGTVVANIEIGGFSVGGLVDVRKASGKFRITGREKGGKVSAELDDKPLTIFYPKPRQAR